MYTYKTPKTKMRDCTDRTPGSYKTSKTKMRDSTDRTPGYTLYMYKPPKTKMKVSIRRSNKRKFLFVQIGNIQNENFSIYVQQQEQILGNLHVENTQN